MTSENTPKPPNLSKMNTLHETPPITSDTQPIIPPTFYESCKSVSNCMMCPSITKDSEIPSDLAKICSKSSYYKKTLCLPSTSEDTEGNWVTQYQKCAPEIRYGEWDGLAMCIFILCMSIILLIVGLLFRSRRKRLMVEQQLKYSRLVRREDSARFANKTNGRRTQY